MSKAVIARLQAHFGDRIIAADDFRGDDEATVAAGDWQQVAKFLRNDDECAMDHFIDITATDYPEREPELPRFDLLLMVRSMKHNHRVRLKTRLGEDDSVDSLVPVWAGANWGEREVYDMFGIRFRGHPDLRRILMYEEFEGYPLRKDYPIDRTQPLVEYRKVEGIHKLPPFGEDEGHPWSRIEWQQRLDGRDNQVSPAIAVQQGQRRSITDPGQKVAEQDLEGS